MLKESPFGWVVTFDYTGALLGLFDPNPAAVILSVAGLREAKQPTALRMTGSGNWFAARALGPRYAAKYPPSTGNTVPVTQEDSLLAR